MVEHQVSHAPAVLESRSHPDFEDDEIGCPTAHTLIRIARSREACWYPDLSTQILNVF